MATLVFEDDFVGAAGPLDGRVRPGGTWEGYGSSLDLDGSGHAVAQAASPLLSLAYTPGMVGATGVEVEFVALLDGDSTGRAALDAGSDASSATANITAQVENAGTDLRITGFGFNFVVPRAGRTTVALRVALTPIGPNMQFDVYVDGVLEHSSVTDDFSLGWESDTYAMVQLTDYVSAGTAIRFDSVAVSRVDADQPAFWTGFQNTYEIR